MLEFLFGLQIINGLKIAYIIMYGIHNYAQLVSFFPLLSGLIMV